MKTTLFLIQLFIASCLLAFQSCSKPEQMSIENAKPIDYSNQVDPDRMTIVLSAPSVHDTYYKANFNDIIDFQTNYARSILGNDNVIVLVDEDTRSFFEGRLPPDVLLTTELYDIWMRDFTTINPLSPVQFVYSWASMPRAQSVRVQNSFIRFADSLGVARRKTHYILDGGNIVDNYAGNVIATTRFLEDNELSETQGVAVLRDLLHATHVAFILPDDEVLAHSDGMVMWANEHTLLVNDYSEFPNFRQHLLSSLRIAFPDVKMIEVQAEWDTTSSGGINSACGINVNAVTTFRNIYVPVFGNATDTVFLQTLTNHTNKNVIPVEAQGVCGMGGSVRCLSWQLTGANATKVIMAARK